MFKQFLNLFIAVFIVLCIPFHFNIPIIRDTVPDEPALSFKAERSFTSPKIILITIDGTRWQEIFYGTDKFLSNTPIVPARQLLPNIYNYFVDNGIAAGRDSSFIATGPMHISLPGYLEIMRGHPSIDCQSNDCNPQVNFSIANLFDTAAVISSWDVIAKTVNSVNNPYINSGRSVRSSNWNSLNLEDNQQFPEYWNIAYRPDFLTQKVAIDYLKLNNYQFVWIGFGDGDEWCHLGNYAEYIKSLQEVDLYINQIINILNDNDINKNYTLIITSDHGRSPIWLHHGFDTESAKNWVLLMGAGVPKKGFVKYSEQKSLSNILPTVKSLITAQHIDGSLLN